MTDGNLNWIVRCTTTGSYTTFQNQLSPNADPTAITKGPDGNVWFAENGLYAPAYIGP